MGDERNASVACRTEDDLWTQRRGIDEPEQVRGASVRRDASGDERRGSKSDCVVQRRSSNEEQPAMQRNQPAAANAPVDLTVTETDRQ